jgi:hypothetical protein
LGLDPLHHLRSALYSVEPPERGHSGSTRRVVLSPSLCGLSSFLHRYSQELVRVRWNGTVFVQRAYLRSLSMEARGRWRVPSRAALVHLYHAHCSDDVPDLLTSGWFGKSFWLRVSVGRVYIPEHPVAQPVDSVSCNTARDYHQERHNHGEPNHYYQEHQAYHSGGHPSYRYQ